MKNSISTEILIKASPEKVWGLLCDFKNYPKWNPFILSIDGELKKGNFLRVNLKPEGSSGMVFKPEVLEIETNRLFCWKGKLGIKGIFDGEHRFELKATNQGHTVFIQSEKFNGILVPFFQKMIHGPTKRSFEAMNTKLKELAEEN